ncbi:MAG: SpaA isopeptide-forming pilin-related protein [Bacillota bacterium]|jgi:hypothetical protein
MKRMKKRLLSVLLCLVMLVGIYPANVIALGASTPAEQIGNHFEANDETGALNQTPELTGNTSKSYANGWVLTDKTISAGEQENEFLITLDVRTKAEIENTVLSEDAAVVIVLDLSNSMTDSMMRSAREAANTFIESFARTEDETAIRKVAVVGFSGYPDRKIDAAKTYQGWTDAADPSISDAIAKMSPNGGTCLQAGLILANNLLNSEEVANISNKNIVVLTDGQPTYYLRGNDADYTSTTSIGYQYIEGTGSNTTHDTHTKTEATANSILKSGIDVYGVFLGDSEVNCTPRKCSLNKSGAEWLREDCGFVTYAAKDMNSLSSIFQGISELIELQAKAWIADDPMGEMFDFAGFVTDAGDPNEYFYNNTNDKITWNLRLATPVEETNDGYKVYQLTYKVKLNTLHSDYEADIYYPTNGVTSVTYFIEKSSQGESSAIEHGTAYFNVPSAKGFTADITFNKVNETGEALAGAEFILTTDDAPNWSMTATSDRGGVVSFAGIPSGHSYKLKEITAPENYLISDTEYEIAISYGELVGTIGENNVVENERVPVDPEIHTISFDISKSVISTGDVAPAGSNIFNFAILDKNGTLIEEPAITVDGIGTGTETVTLDNLTEIPDALYVQEITERVPSGWVYDMAIYKVTFTVDTDGEVIPNIEKFDPASESYVSADNITFTNSYHEETAPDPDPEYGNLTVSKTVSGGGASTSKEFTFTVTLDSRISGTYGDMTFESGVATFTLKHGENKTATNLPAGISYAVVESDNSGYTVTVNGTSETTATGTIAQDSTATAAFNNYKSGGGNTDPDPDGGVKIIKTVKGDKAPAESIEYEFKAWIKTGGNNAVSERVSYKITAADGTTASSGSLTIETDGHTFYLKDGESITFSGITSGRRMEVKEVTTGDFTTTTNGLTDGYCVISSNTTKTVEFINDYGNTTPTEPTAPTTPSRPLDDLPQTGDDSDMGLWLALACLSLFGMGAAMIGRKRFSTRRSR